MLCVENGYAFCHNGYAISVTVHEKQDSTTSDHGIIKSYTREE